VAFNFDSGQFLSQSSTLSVVSVGVQTEDGYWPVRL